MANRIKILTCFGTRPEAIKMAPLIKELERTPEFEAFVCVSAQHREMLDQVLDAFEIVPDFDLDIMKRGQDLTYITNSVLKGLDRILKRLRPDMLLVHGDTTTTFAASLAAFYNKTAVGHVEAGLRTYNSYSPYPEEMNRRLTANIAAIHFAPTLRNRENLLKENINEHKIYVTGNTAIDALKTTVSENYEFKNSVLKSLDFNSKRIITLTAHRRENLGLPIYEIFRAVRRIADEFEDVMVIDPVHLNPIIRKAANEIFSGSGKIILTDPLDVFDMHNLMARSYLVMTDSGGLQEEAPSLGKPVLVLRTETERQEAVAAGTVKLAGIRENDIYREAKELLSDHKAYTGMSSKVNPYGDGKASGRIKNALLYFYGIIVEKPADWKVCDV